jgi:hypothetical protein
MTGAHAAVNRIPAHGRMWPFSALAPLHFTGGEGIEKAVIDPLQPSYREGPPMKKPARGASMHPRAAGDETLLVPPA